jgi:hypothetical protein
VEPRLFPPWGPTSWTGGSSTRKAKVLVRSFCKNRRAFLAKRARVVSFAEEMGQALDQESVIVLASSSDSVLVELRLEDST